MRKILIIFIIAISYNNIIAQDKFDLINKSLQKLNQIDCLYYKSNNGSSAPYDTVINNTYTMYSNLKMNDLDTLIGANFNAYLEDSTKIYMSYQDSILNHYDWDSQNVRIDTLRPDNIFLMTPFYPMIKGLFEYVNRNRDSISINIEKEKDLYKIGLIFKNKYVRAQRKPIVRKNDKTSYKYYIWIDKTNMPIKFLCKRPNQVSSEEILWYKQIKNVELSGTYLPDNFSIYNRHEKRATAADLEGKVAKFWNLSDSNGNPFKISDYRGQNLLLEFTSIGCGHCQAAIPFLNSFTKNFKDKDFQVLSIMANYENADRIKRYETINNFDYKLLKAKENTFSNYNISGVPVFVIINPNGIIEKAFIGYSKEITDKKIIKYANKMCSK